MKRVRVVLVVLGLALLPFVAARAQGHSDDNKCKVTPASSHAQANARGRDGRRENEDRRDNDGRHENEGRRVRGAAAEAHEPPGQAKKCPDPVPPPPPAPVPPPPPPPPPPAPVPPPPPPPPAPVPPPPPPPPPPAPVPPPPPPPDTPPSGPHSAIGMVFEDLDGNGARDPFSGEMGLAGWQVQLIWNVNGQVIATSTTDQDGNFQFQGLGNSSYSICVVGQAGYTQTYPVNLFSNCGGMGYDFSPNTVIAQQFQGDFGMKLQ